MNKELLQQVLDDPHLQMHPDHRRALKSALAAPQPEPVAYGMQDEHGVFVDAISPEEQHRYPGEYTVPLYAAPPAAPAPVVPDGMALVPDYRGYAALGTGQYLLDISGDANPAELIIHLATDAEKEGRTVGDLRDKAKPGEVIQPEKMAVRLAFFTVAGLDALEQQLRILRETHFAESAAPVVPLTDEQIDNIADALLDNGGCTMLTLARAIEQAHGIRTTGGGK